MILEIDVVIRRARQLMEALEVGIFREPLQFFHCRAAESISR
jgi:hypothetical protein